MASGNRRFPSRKREKEALEQELESLYAEKVKLETVMSGGTMSVEEITTAAARMQEILDRLDEAEMRMLELMEKES